MAPDDVVHPARSSVPGAMRRSAASSSGCRRWSATFLPSIVPNGCPLRAPARRRRRFPAAPGLPRPAAASTGDRRAAGVGAARPDEHAVPGLRRRGAPRDRCRARQPRAVGPRNELWPAYQGQRDTFEPLLVRQLDERRSCSARSASRRPRCRRTRPTTCWRSLATLEEDAGGTALVLTSDRDAFQLVSEQVTVSGQAAAGRSWSASTPRRAERYGCGRTRCPT